MAYEWNEGFVLGLTWTLRLLQQVCMVVVAVLIALRMGWLRAAVYGARRSAWHALITVCLFTVLAVIGTHSGIVVNIDRGAIGAWPAALPTRLAAMKRLSIFATCLSSRRGSSVALYAARSSAYWRAWSATAWED